MIYTTLNKIRDRSPCEDGWKKLLKYLGKTHADDELLALSVILDSNGLNDALWCLRSVPEENRRWRKLAVAYARTVQHLMTDPRSVDALDVADRHADGDATDAELRTAWDAAWDAARAAARAAAGAAARDAARDAAWDAAWAAAWDAAGDAAWDAAWDAARAAAWDAARDRMSDMLRECLDFDMTLLENTK